MNGRGSFIRRVDVGGGGGGRNVNRTLKQRTIDHSVCYFFPRTGAKVRGAKQPFTEMSNWTPCAHQPEFNQAPVPTDRHQSCAKSKGRGVVKEH